MFFVCWTYVFDDPITDISIYANYTFMMNGSSMNKVHFGIFKNSFLIFSFGSQLP